jgi:hypothetical protein
MNIHINETTHLLCRNDIVNSLILDVEKSNLTDSKIDREFEIAEYLKKIRNSSKQFIKSNIVWDRVELRNILDNILDDEGNFVVLLAGKSTGKSLVLRNLALSRPQNVFYVDLRVNPSIVKGLISVLNSYKREGIRRFFIGLMIHIFGKYLKQQTLIDIDVQKVLDLIKDKEEYESLNILILELVEKYGSVTLIIDEANLAFAVDSTASKDEINSVKAALALFTSLTKQERKVKS